MRQVSFLLISTVSLLTACVEGSNESTRQEAELTTNRITANRITANRITANRIAANRIAANRISANRLTLNGTADDLLATADGREVLSVLVGCAIPEGITLEATRDGTTFEFPGAIGVAPEWLQHRLEREGQGWVSACVFARINGHDVSVSISARGPHPALALDPGERQDFSVEEGAFYGNMFTPLDQPILWIACRGKGQVLGQTGLEDRVCATPDPDHPGLTQCGFFFAGDCGHFSDEPVCDHFSESGEFYEGCHAAPVDRKDHRQHDSDSGYGGHDDHVHGHVFREVITTFVTPF